MVNRAFGRLNASGRRGIAAGVFAAAVFVLGSVGFLVVIATGNLCITSTQRLPDRYDGSAIPALAQASDRDCDGIPDGADILQGALDYVASRPRYRSAYYQGGYPTDGCGVCTDLVAAACRVAGYDLRGLVDADVRARPDAYADGDAPDSNIDYRRVRNLRAYFRHAATELTTDVAAIDQWQPGDIVLFDDHIGIISDRRNERGVPYLIHHANPFQLRYEEDVLESYGDVTDHVRLP